MAKEHNQKFVELVDDAKRRIQEIDPDALYDRLEKNPDLELVDVREESEYAAGHVRGARHLSKGILERDVEEEIPDPATEIVLYCGGGYRSALAAENLQKMGYRNVYSLAGGFRAVNEDRRFEME
jgi:rhodanese-related sulfurtransferase